jgi:hypothetical protein
LSSGFAQQARPQHRQCFEPQHLLAAGAVFVATSFGMPKTLCQTVTKLTKTAKNTVATLLSRADLEFVNVLFISLSRFRFAPAAGMAVQNSIS